MIKLPASLGTLARNESYTITIKLKTLNYLFEDSSVGVLADKGARTPIAWVVEEKTDTQDGKAMGLKDAGNGEEYPFYSDYVGELFYGMDYDFDNVSDEEGEKWTYTPYQVDFSPTPSDYSLPWVKRAFVKADEETYFPVFYHAAHYGETLGVAISGTIKRWYLPGSGEWAKALNLLGIPTQRNYSQIDFTIDEDNPGKLVSVFEDAGGERIFDKWYVSSTQYYVKMAYNIILRKTFHYIRPDYYVNGYVRAFVRF